MDLEYLKTTIDPYLEYLPAFGLAILTTFLITPIVGFIMRKLEIQDLSATQMKTGEKGILQRINKTVAPRGGALALGITFVIFALLTEGITKQMGAILLSVVILVFFGLLDDKHRSSWFVQLIPQGIAALIVIAAGMSIDSIQNPADTSINLRAMVIPFTLGANEYSFAFPADILTLVWILLVMQGVNWIFGLNGLGEGVSIIVFLTILFVSIELGSPVTAMLAAIMAGSTLGFLPFTIFPAKIISGSSNIYGFLIAIFSILGGVKVSTAVIVLIIPLLDMLWVMIGRINRQGVNGILDTIVVATRGDHTHLHHRLLKLGLSVPQVTIVEWLAVGICAIAAFMISDLPKVTMLGLFAVVCLLFFLLISILLRKGVKLRKKKVPPQQQEPERDPTDTPESRYAY